MTSATYSPPVNHLLALGDVRHAYEWPDYLNVGLRPEHIPDLIRMALDDELHHADADSHWVWAPVHAWRALAQLHTAEAVVPLLDLLDRYVDENDYVMSELPEVFGMIGIVALPALQAFLTDSSRRLYARITAATSIERVGNSFPETRVECITALASQLEHFEGDDPALNAFLIDALIDLDAVEAVAVMERAFAAGRVDESVAGNWDDAQVSLGLKEPEGMEWVEGDSAPSGILPGISAKHPRQVAHQGQSDRKAKAKAKTKRRIAQASRRRNRKRK